ncbi:hypothetical protein FRC11_013135 [Ceratobasidium sp. 423]|nr:hypothetical protein FRC11_013135 [Ceratobasidium sp. 423]
MSDTPLLIGLTLATGLLTYKLYRDQQGNELSLPPSPKSYPLIGHLLSVPKEYEHLGFAQLGEQLGNKIISLSVFGTTIIVLNDRDDAVNLFDKRSATYSDRTCAPMVQEPALLDWGDVVSLIGYGDRWRRFRRLMNPWLTKQAVVAHDESQERATRKLLQRLLTSHEDIGSSDALEAEIGLSTSATLFRSLYGYEVQDAHDPLAVRAQKLVSYLTYALLASNYWVNTIPALRYVPDWFPGTGWKREVLEWRKEKESLIDELYNIGLENMDAHEPIQRKDESTHIMVASFRQQALKLGLTEKQADDDVKQVSITFLGGTFSTLWNAYKDQTAQSLQLQRE